MPIPVIAIATVVAAGATAAGAAYSIYASERAADEQKSALKKALERDRQRQQEENKRAKASLKSFQAEMQALENFKISSPAGPAAVSSPAGPAPPIDFGLILLIGIGILILTS